MGGALKFTGFMGAFPIRDPRQLPDNAAAQAMNLRVASGGLEPFRAPRLIKTVAAGTRRVYRIPTGPLQDLSSGASYWMEFADPGTDVIRTPVANDSFERYYWCSPSTGLRFATKAQILAGQAGKTLAVNRPTGQPPVAVTPGTGQLDPATGKNVAPNVTRAYVITYVDEFGQESQPSDSRIVTGPSDADFVVSLTGIQPVPNPALPTVYQLRIYRTITGASGAGQFFLVTTVATGLTAYADRLPDSVVASNPTLGSATWAAPPAMDGIALMPGGIFVGFKGNNLYFSEPYRPHAWPAEYTLTVQYPIVGLGVFGNTAVVCTQGYPSTVSGSTPASMTLTTSDTPLPCLSRGSIVSAPEGVYYATTNGLALVSASGTVLIADSIIGREGWTEFAPGTIQAVLTRGNYTGIRTLAGAELGFMIPSSSSYQITSPLPQSQTGITQLDGFTGGGTSTCGTDPWSGKAWLLTNGALYEWLPAEPAATPLSMRWRSREVQTEKPVNFGVAQAYFAGGSLRLRVFADGTLIYDQDISARSGHAVRLPSGLKTDVWQFEVEGTARVSSLVVGEAPASLKQV